MLGDELLTPDSSRFWPLEEWAPGRPQFAFDKQYVRDWAAATGWDKNRARARSCRATWSRSTRGRYVAAYERITGRRWSWDLTATRQGGSGGSAAERAEAHAPGLGCADLDVPDERARDDDEPALVVGEPQQLPFRTALATARPRRRG